MTVNKGTRRAGIYITAEQTKLFIRMNEAVADLFPRMHMVERPGMGIHKMKEAMVAAGLHEPTFKPDGFFRAVLGRPCPASR